MSRIIVDSIRNSSASSDGITLASDGSITIPGNVTCSGTASGFGGGKILQVVQESKKNVSSQAVNAASYDYSSGLSNGLISKTITPSNSSNKILIRASLLVGAEVDMMVFAQLFKAGSVIDAARGDTSNKQRVSAGLYISSAGRVGMLTHEYLDTAGGTSAITYDYRFSHDASSTKTIYLNRDHTNSGNTYFSRGYSSLTLMEISA